MPTAKKRVNVTMGDDTFRLLERLAKRSHRSLSAVSLDMIEHALKLEEDRYFSGVADERLAREEKRISHEKAWRGL